MNIPLRFIPPLADNIQTLHIWESPLPTGPFAEIDSTPAGTFPEYINEFITTHATSSDNWFAIQWSDTSGIRGELSDAVKGGTTTLIGELVQRVLLRDDSFEPHIALQEAEAVVSWIYQVDDPSTINISSVSKLWLTELTNLLYVSIMYQEAIKINSSAHGYSAGIISESTSAGGAKATLDSLDQLERRALKRMGIGGSRIASFIQSRGFFLTGEKFAVDSSRLLSTREIIVEHIMIEDIPSGEIISVD